MLDLDAAQTAINQMLKLSVVENLNVNGVFADIIHFDVYDVALIERLLLILQRDKIRKMILEKFSSTVCCDSYYWIVDTLKNYTLICNYFKYLKQDWEIIKNKKGFLFAHKIKRE